LVFQKNRGGWGVEGFRYATCDEFTMPKNSLFFPNFPLTSKSTIQQKIINFLQLQQYFPLNKRKPSCSCTKHADDYSATPHKTLHSRHSFNKRHETPISKNPIIDIAFSSHQNKLGVKMKARRKPWKEVWKWKNNFVGKSITGRQVRQPKIGSEIIMT